MGKNDFDIDFDFDEEFDFDPKAFLGDEGFDNNIDLNAFSDEELGLTSQTASETTEDTAAPEEDPNLDSDFDLDEDLDLDEFLNMGSKEEEIEEEDPEENWEEEPDYSANDEAEFEEEDTLFEEKDAAEEYAEEDFDEDPDLPEDTEPEEIAMNENMEYTEDEDLMDQPVFEDEDIPEDDEQAEDSAPRKRQRKERKAPKMPKIKLPKLKTPNIFTKFFDLYFAPVLSKDWQYQNEPQDPNNPRRRRKKSKSQIFKEVYLPPILACVCLILVMSFLIGSLSNVIEQRRIDKETQQSQLDASISAAEQAELETQRVLAEAAELASGYDYQSAIDKLDSLGDLTQYPDISAKRVEYVNARDALVEYKDPTMIPNLSFHVLIHDMARAKADAELGASYNKNFVTTGEFTKILEQLYNNGYVLVDFDSFVGSTTDVNGNEQFEPISMWLPADKKPVMITETMVNYFAYMVDGDGDGVADAKGDGFASKLVLDDNGDIKAEYIDANGQTLVGNYDLVPILEDFIKQHPDFSYRGARAILAVTGHEGVFGYRINTSVVSTKGNDYWESECAGAKKIANALQEKGYTLACYTYKNDPYKSFSVAQIQADLQSWTQQVTSVIGVMDTFVFAKTSNISDYSGSAFQVMYQSGFRYFISNADSPTTEVNSTYVRQNRVMVTGETMQHYSSRFTGMFDCAAILDVNTRGNVPTN